MITQADSKSIRTAALVAGIALICSVIAAPLAEMYVFPKLVIPYRAAETANNILQHRSLFIAGIFAYFITFIIDVVLAWALYILLKPVDKHLSLLTALFRLVYSVIALVAVNNLVSAFQLLDSPGYATVFETPQLYAQAMLFLRAFKNHWYFGIPLFAVHLLLLGYLAFKSSYIPRFIGVLLIITGLGYLLTSLRPYLFPHINVDFAKYTFYGELVFMFWLLIKGTRLKAPAE
jgi:hypothetical protein